jgi:hypothetical protein
MGTLSNESGPRGSPFEGRRLTSGVSTVERCIVSQICRALPRSPPIPRCAAKAPQSVAPTTTGAFSSPGSTKMLQRWKVKS